MKIKYFKLTLLLTVLMSMVGTKTLAHAFGVANADGVIIYYIYNEGSDGTTVSVSYQGNTYYYSNEYSGDIVIPESVTYNGKTYSVTIIGDWAFASSSGLTSVTIPNSVTSIRSAAFVNCRGLTSVTIPNSVTSIGGSAFEYCTGLTSIKVETGNTKYDSRDNCNAIIETASNMLIVGCKNSTIPNSVTSIGKLAFYGCSGLPSITIPNSVTSIGNSAFYGCSGLTSITIPNSVTSIGDRAFYGCSGLLDMFCYAKNVPTTGSDAFYSSNIANATLHVPAGSVGAYQAADQWKNFKEIVEQEIETTDITALNNVIYLDEEEAVIGTQKSLSFKMKNTAAIRGFQFNMTLPEGVTPATYSNGTIMCSLSDARRPEGDQHTISVTQQADGSYKFLCGSLANETFTGTDGEVLTLKVNIAGDMKAGDYPITLSSMKLTETNIDNYYETAEVVSKLTVSDCVLGDITGDGTVDVSDYIGVANYILGKTPAGFNKLAADVNNDGVVDVADYIGIANIILTGSIYGK